ncbi:MAG TPA: dTDP-4-dehydrorhamnose 3,5-epimerase [Herbaspirillum sp.]|jgi:dTDP-4-dehydrorhamnose 3,5-epimerase
MRVIPTSFPDVLLLEPRIFEDARGAFHESFNARVFERQAGICADFVQDNHSTSRRLALRGLHYQIRHPQGKLVRVVAGEILDVVVDIRKGSPRFGQWLGTILSAQDRCQLWVPPGYAHGYLALGDNTEVLYKTTDYWMPEHERCILWNDPAIGIDWGMAEAPLLSEKDMAGSMLADAELFD